MVTDRKSGVQAPGQPRRRQPLINRLVLAGLRSPLHPVLDAGMTALRYSTRERHEVTLPVGFVRSGQVLVVQVGRSSTKTWWRHFLSAQPVDVWWRGAWRPTTARVLAVGTREHAAAAAAYAARHPRVTPSNDPVVVVDLPAGPATAQLSGRRLWRAWTGWVTLGEFAGFAVPAMTAAVLGDFDRPAAAVLLVAAGAVEGGLLGAAQAHVLRRALPCVDRKQWVLATSAAAALAWSIGLLPMLTNGFASVSAAVWIPMATVLCLVLLLSIGTAQWLVLRRQVEHSAVWILTTAGAWAAGLTVFTAVTTPLWQPSQPVALVGAIGVVGGLLMAFTVAALTGWAISWLCRRSTSAVAGIADLDTKTVSDGIPGAPPRP